MKQDRTPRTLGAEDAASALDVIGDALYLPIQTFMQNEVDLKQHALTVHEDQLRKCEQQKERQLAGKTRKLDRRLLNGLMRREEVLSVFP